MDMYKRASSRLARSASKKKSRKRFLRKRFLQKLWRRLCPRGQDRKLQKSRRREKLRISAPILLAPGPLPQKLQPHPCLQGALPHEAWRHGGEAAGEKSAKQPRSGEDWEALWSNPTWPELDGTTANESLVDTRRYGRVFDGATGVLEATEAGHMATERFRNPVVPNVQAVQAQDSAQPRPLLPGVSDMLLEQEIEQTRNAERERAWELGAENAELSAHNAVLEQKIDKLKWQRDLLLRDIEAAAALIPDPPPRHQSPESWRKIVRHIRAMAATATAITGGNDRARLQVTVEELQARLVTKDEELREILEKNAQLYKRVQRGEEDMQLLREGVSVFKPAYAVDYSAEIQRAKERQAGCALDGGRHWGRRENAGFAAVMV